MISAASEIPSANERGKFASIKDRILAWLAVLRWSTFKLASWLF